MKNSTGLYKLLLIIISVNLTQTCWGLAARKKAFMAISTYYSVFEDIKLAETTAELIEPAIGVEFAFRLYSVFSFLVVAERSFQDNELISEYRTDYGIGMRIDMPGIFFLRSTLQDFKKSKKRRPVNTSLFLHILQTTSTDKATSENVATFANKYGFNIDIFLFNKVTYLTLIGAVYGYEGNSFSSYGAGLGMEF